MPEDEQQQPSFPMTNIQIAPQGLIINTMLTPTLTIGQLIDENTMNQVCRDWLKTRKEIKSQLEVVRNGSIQPLIKKGK